MFYPAKETKELPIWKVPLLNCNYNKCIIVSSKVKLEMLIEFRHAKSDIFTKHHKKIFTGIVTRLLLSLLLSNYDLNTLIANLHNGNATCLEVGVNACCSILANC